MTRKVVVSLLLILAYFAGAQTIEIPQYDPNQKWVTDLTGTLSQAEVASLATLCNNLERANGAEMAVLITRSTPTGEISLEEYTLKIAMTWGIGKKEGQNRDNGVLLYISLDRNMRIEVGDGNQGALPDITCGRIMDYEIIPKLQQGDFYGGINAGLIAIDKTLRHEYGEEGYSEPGFKNTTSGKFVWGFFIGLVGICIAITVFCFGHYKTGLAIGGAIGVISLHLLMALCGFWIALGIGIVVTAVVGGFFMLVGSADLEGGGGTYTPSSTTFKYTPRPYSPPSRPSGGGGGSFGSRSFGGSRGFSGGGASRKW